MKTTDLKKFTNKAKKLHSKKNTVPVFDKILIKDGKMIFKNLENSIVYPCDFTMKNGIIDHNFLQKIVSKVKSKNIDIIVGEKRNQVLIKTDSSCFQCIEEIDPRDFPSLLELTKQPVVENVSSEDVSRIKKSSIYALDDKLRPVLNTVLIDPGYIVATDAHRMSFHKRENPGENQFILTTKTIELLDQGQNYEIQKGGHIYLNNEDMTIIQKEDFSDQKYPNWKSVIREKSGIAVRGLSVKPFIEALQESDIAANQASHEVLLYIDPSREIVNLRSKDLDFQTGYNCNLKAEKIEGEPLTVGIKTTFMLSILKNEDFQEVDLFFEDASHAMHINNELLLMLTNISEIEDLEPTVQELNQAVKS